MIIDDLELSPFFHISAATVHCIEIIYTLVCNKYTYVYIVCTIYVHINRIRKFLYCRNERCVCPSYIVQVHIPIYYNTTVRYDKLHAQLYICILYRHSFNYTHQQNTAYKIQTYTHHIHMKYNT